MYFPIKHLQPITTDFKSICFSVKFVLILIVHRH